MSDAEFAVAARFSDAEAEAWRLLGDAASACMRLAREDQVHSMEPEEMAHAIHFVQARLLARPALRAVRDATSDRPLTSPSEAAFSSR